MKKMYSDMTYGTKIIDIRDGSELTVDIIEEYPEGSVVYTLEKKCIPIEYIQLKEESIIRIVWECIVNDQEVPQWIQKNPNYKGPFPSLYISDSEFQKRKKKFESLKKNKNNIFSFTIFGYTFNVFKS
jgi:hypothetical protein